ncbi:uncharacterized protein LOC112568472 [Pomacea canaliculata]|uniref:uncharacterized protein LOC112568472 n=1 Tax=Pomacea canaliculata TaxID=400727 RepID=UPI000D72B167|nr:uncharacterized protein LOC112568472 [Pomacea canaliculata]
MTEHRFMSLTFQRAIHLRIAIIVVTGIAGLTAMVFFAKGLKTLPDSMCPLYANLTVHSGKSHSKAMLYLNTEISDWGQVSVCQFVIYLYVYVFIISHIWLWIILGSDLRDNYHESTATLKDVAMAKKTRDLKSTHPSAHSMTLISSHFYDRRGPLFVLPFLAIHIILLVACTISLILLTNGLSTLCDNLRRNSHENVTCLDLQSLELTMARTLTNIPFFYSSIVKGTTFAWVTLLCLTAQIIVTLAQVQVSLNYDSPAISMSPALSKPGLSPARTPPPSPARSLSSISMSFVSPSKMSSASLSPSTEADLHLLETDKEETESSNIIN